MWLVRRKVVSGRQRPTRFRWRWCGAITIRPGCRRCCCSAASAWSAGCTILPLRLLPPWWCTAATYPYPYSSPPPDVCMYITLVRSFRSGAAARKRPERVGDPCFERNEALQRRSYRVERVQCLGGRDGGSGEFGTGVRVCPFVWSLRVGRIWQVDFPHMKVSQRLFRLVVGGLRLPP